MNRYHIFITSPEHFTAVQFRLLELGYSWRKAGATFIRSSNTKRISLNRHGNFSLGRSSNDSSPPRSEEVTLADLYKDSVVADLSHA
jgi:hypothetical protein